MCTGKCSRCVAVALYPLVVLSIMCNIMLFFPGWDTKYAKEGLVTQEVKLFGGLIGGGIMVLVSALYIHMTGKKGRCGNRCGMFFSIPLAAVGVAGAVFSFIVATRGLYHGPLCKGDDGKWSAPFINSNWNYLINSESWAQCTEPKNVVQFNTGLFITLIAASSLQGLLCVIQIINGLFGCLCGTCIKKQEA